MTPLIEKQTWDPLQRTIFGFKITLNINKIINTFKKLTMAQKSKPGKEPKKAPAVPKKSGKGKKK